VSQSPRRRWWSFPLEIVRWAVVIWLLWPLQNALSERVSFTRIAVGILLLVLFTGKLLYDTLLDPLLTGRRRDSKLDWVTLVVVILLVALVVALTTLFVVAYLARRMQLSPLE